MTKQGGCSAGAKSIIILFMILAGFLLWPFFIWAKDQTVQINEIAWMGTLTSSNDEWIELYNMSDEDVILDGWYLTAQDRAPNIELAGIIKARNYFLLERTDDDSIPEIAADQIYTGALGNQGEVLELRNETDMLIDEINAGDGWPGGDNASKQTLVRNENLDWATSQNSGGTPGYENIYFQQNDIKVESEINTTDTNIATSGEGVDIIQDDQQESLPDNDQPYSVLEKNTPANETYVWGDIVINEFCSDPGDNEEEWIELYNTTGADIKLDDWFIKEGSGSKTILTGQISDDNNYLIAPKPKGNLNNSGDLIKLYWQNTVIDQVSYGDWEDGDIENNSPVASDPYSVARIFDGKNSGNNFNDFAITKTPTKGSSNIIEEIKETYNFIFNDKITITELMPDPTGPDIENEFLEIFNSGNSQTDLSGWRISDESGRIFELNGIEIAAGEYMPIYRSQTKIAMNNNQDSLLLYPPESQNPKQEIKYSNVQEGWSFSWSSSTKKWLWSKIPTPGQENIIKLKNEPPLVSFYCPSEAFSGHPIIFDSSDTTDDNRENLNFFWDFGDGASNTLPVVEHTFFIPAIYTIKLEVSDGENMADSDCVVHVKEIEQSKLGIGEEEPKNKKDENQFIVINEFIPNPIGSDEAEWIELYNIGKDKINLRGWSIDDSEGGSKPFVWQDDEIIAGMGYMLVLRKDSRIALNNKIDQVRLLDSDEIVVDKIEYTDSKEGMSFARFGINWQWTKKPTPGSQNILTDSENNEEEFGTINKDFIKINIRDINDLEIGEKVITSGTVIARPGVLSSQYFYIQDEKGLQIYNYYKEFPDIKTGDIVRVTGELSRVNGESRIKTKSENDIIIISSGNKVEPIDVECADLNEEMIGGLIRAEGVVTGKKSSYIFLDDSTEECRLYINNSIGVELSSITLGTEMSVVGIVNKTKSGIRLVPRQVDDLSIADLQNVENDKEAGKILGKIESNYRWDIPARDKKMEFFHYIAAVCGALLAIFIIILIKIIREERTQKKNRIY